MHDLLVGNAISWASGKESIYLGSNKCVDLTLTLTQTQTRLGSRLSSEMNTRGKKVFQSRSLVFTTRLQNTLKIPNLIYAQREGPFVE